MPCGLELACVSAVNASAHPHAHNRACSSELPSGMIMCACLSAVRFARYVIWQILTQQVLVRSFASGPTIVRATRQAPV